VTGWACTGTELESEYSAAVQGASACLLHAYRHVMISASQPVFGSAVRRRVLWLGFCNIACFAQFDWENMLILTHSLCSAVQVAGGEAR
jgi:hypothetical protein